MLMHVIWLNYGIPSVLLILFFLKFLNRPEFKYSFYRVLQCDMVMNLLCYLNTWIQRLCNVSSTIPTMLWFYQNSYFIFPIQSYFGHFFFNEQAMSVIILSLHRLSSSVSTLGNEFWNRNYLRAYAIIILISTAITTPIYFGEYMKPYIYVPEKQAFQSGPVDTDKRSVASTVFSIQMWTYFTVIFIINIITIIVVRKRFSSEFTSPKTRALMRNLTTIAFINTIVFAFVILWQPFYKAVVEFDRTINNYVMMFLSDALSLTLPYILLICDRNVRTSVVRMIGDYIGPVPTRNSVTQRTVSMARIG